MDSEIGRKWVYKMGARLRSNIDSTAGELRDILQEHLGSGEDSSKEYTRDLALFTELCIWMREENETEVDGQERIT